MDTVREVWPGTRRYTQHTVYELAESIRERDAITYEHCRRVAIYVNRLAHALGWSRRAGRDLALAGLVHDLGKTWMQNSILLKDAPLSRDERQEMERHPRIAARILDAYGAPEVLVQAVLYHHEAYNGAGYPDGLCGEAIPLGARLLSVADVFDALTSARPYKSPMALSIASEWLEAGAGSRFDPHAVSAFIGLIGRQPDFLLPTHTDSLYPQELHAGWVRHDVFEH